MVIVDHAFLDPEPSHPPAPAVDANGVTRPVLILQTPINLTMEDMSQFDKLPARNRQLHRWAMSRDPLMPTVEMARECASKVTPSLGDIPLAVISTGNENPAYLRLQKELLKLSSKSTYHMATGSVHAVQIDQPEVVIEAIREVVEAVRSMRIASPDGSRRDLPFPRLFVLFALFILACGTTGEDPGLTPEEHERVVETIVATAAGRIFVMVGTGSNSTAHTIDLTAQAERAGAQAALVVNPYYNKPTQEGLYRHFRAVAESTSLPVFVYNIQSRTAVNVETATLERLVRDCRNIVGVKEASGSLDQMSQVIAACGPDFIVLSGDDNITLPLMAVGGRGVISVIANIVPRDTADLVHAALDGDFKRARELHYKLYPLARAAFLETNPIPIKEAMAMAGMLEPEFRLPMCRMTDANRERLRAILKPYGLVK